jgi:hypothetical protein
VLLEAAAARSGGVLIFFGPSGSAFETRYNTIARPFSWNFTHNDLEDLLHRIDTHDNRQPHALAA